VFDWIALTKWLQHLLTLTGSILSLKVATETKIRNGFTKYILREAMKGLLPEPIRVRRNKLGFATPLMDWVQG
jgi:asparagine synthetase B (glutamine-hydrolysing)